MTMRLRTLPVLLACCAFMAAAPAGAQIIQFEELPDADPAQTETFEGYDPGLVTERQPQYGAAEPAATSPQAPAEVLLPLRAMHPEIGDQTRYTLRGVVDEADFVMFLPAAPGATTLMLSTLSTINVLPERSRLDVLVNGKLVGTASPENFDAFRRADIPLPEGALHAGRNLVTLRAEHTHRVFCGPDADFGLWTSVALDRSGIMLNEGEFDTDALGFLSAVAAGAARAQPISVHGSGDSQLLEFAMPIIARIEDSFGGVPPEIRFDGYYSTSTGLPELARVTTLPEGISLDGGYQIRRGGDGAIVLLVEHDGYEAAGESLLAAIPEGSIEQAPPRLTPGKQVSFESMGLENIRGEGRYIRRGVTFRLPPDWLLLASQKARMRLLYRYDTGLPEGSLMLVKVNGTTVRLLPLDLPEVAGQVLPVLPVDFGAALLNPGLNRIDFEALIPGDPPDSACEPRSNPAFEISNRTTVYVPDSPAMSLPGIERVMANLEPSGITMTDTARARLPEGLLPQIAALYDREGSDEDNDAVRPGFGLTIATPRDISLLEGTLANDQLAAMRIVLTAPAATAPVEEEEPDAWEQVEANGWLKAVLNPDRLLRLPREIGTGVEALWRGEAPPLEEWLAKREGEAVLLQPDPDAPAQAWLILGAQADPQRIVETLAKARWSIDGPRGQVSLYSQELGWQNWISPQRRLVLHERLSLKNLRAVAGNFASSQPWSFIAIIMAFTLCSAIVGMIIAVLARRRN
ncbi:MAG: cellulose biosynthesis cyclic di-GMP-binding regulatory protein BcsB [Rhodobacteraceae bacterium]|nr:cellulose biosynthesis cyclic di-GMP-binding regulatory protein BcsB [Paracoccaceae bacterium]